MIKQSITSLFITMLTSLAQTHASWEVLLTSPSLLPPYLLYTESLNFPHVLLMKYMLIWADQCVKSCVAEMMEWCAEMSSCINHFITDTVSIISDFHMKITTMWSYHIHINHFNNHASSASDFSNTLLFHIYCINLNWMTIHFWVNIYWQSG